MLAAISRYGARVVSDTEQTVAACRQRGELVQGPQIAEFERAFEKRLGHGQAISASYGRMAFYYILKALDLPPGSEIVVPGLTFWVMPELARVAGLTLVFADVNPDTFTLDPASLERVITDRTRAVVPTHLYGLPCDMDAILALAARHNLKVIEDCAHALGATYRGRQVGTLGDAAIFSFQTLKPLNTYGGGMALVQDPSVAHRVAELAYAEKWPSEERVLGRLRVGRLQRVFTRPAVFSVSAFPILWLSSWVDWNPDVYLWEKIRSLDPLPAEYTERYSNVQATLGLKGLARLDEWTAATQAHALRMNEALSGLRGVQPPVVPPDRTHVYYQYCVYGPDRDRVVLRAIRRGVDIEVLHVDVCADMELFDDASTEMPGARRTTEAFQVPVYASLTDEQLARIARVVRDVLADLQPAAAAAPASRS